MLSELVKKNPDPNFMAKLRATPTDALFSATICVMEHQILPKIRILPFSYKEAVKAGDLIHHLYSIGQPIGIEDIMIASIALCNGLTVVSANTKHFSRIPNLKTENWFQ